MTESHGPAAGSPGWPDPADLAALHALVIRFIRGALEESGLRDRDDDLLFARVSAIEEVFAARWPRRWLLAVRLRRVLRASVRNIEVGGTFAERRIETASLLVHPGGEPVAPAPDGAE